MPEWVDAGFADYAGRMPRECRLDLREIPLSRYRRSGDTARAVRDEGERMLGAIGPSDLVVALDVGGRSFGTADLADQLDRWLHAGSDVSFLVGGPDGLSRECLARAG
jgi:23S rRNA (pseudouridine1915-N3)-methyltransferase